MNWKKHHTLLQTLLQQQLFSYIYLLCFNVRGLKLRWGEVCLLVQKHHSDILVLGELEQVDLSLVGAALANYNVFYQAGDNSHGGVLVLTRKDIIVTRVTCSLPNVCVIDIPLSEPIRMIAIYAPVNKTWSWTDLRPFITSRCMIMGDFNVDIERDGDKADRLLEWMDSGSLRPVVHDANTSLLSDRIIDYAVTTNVDLSIQTYEGMTSSDHKPLLGVFTDEDPPKHEGSRTKWSVFSLFLAYTYDYWEQKEWNTQSSESTYEQFISFLTLLSNRCQHLFPLNRARPSVPWELMKLLAKSRSLSFKAKRKGDIELRNGARRLRNFTRFELKRFQQEQLTVQLKDRYVPGEGSHLFWNKTKRHFKHISSSMRGFETTSGGIIKDSQDMAKNTIADYYERLFEAPVVIRPHPYVDAPPVRWDNASDPVPSVTYPEIINILRTRKKK